MHIQRHGMYRHSDIDIKKIHDERKKYIVSGLSGLNNTGNTCFLASLLQVLSNTEMLRAYIFGDECKTKVENFILSQLIKNIEPDEEGYYEISKDVKKEMIKKTLTFKLKNLFNKLWFGEYISTYDTNEVYEFFRKKYTSEWNDNFVGGKQNDPQELFLLLQDSLDEELGEKVKKVDFKICTYKKSVYNQIKSINDDINKTKVKSEILKLENKLKHLKNANFDSFVRALYYYEWEKTIKKNHSIITELFTGMYLAQTSCTVCKNREVRFEPYCHITVPINKNMSSVDLYDCFKEFKKDEYIDEYNCDSCKNKVKCAKNITVWNAPEYLVIHLNRSQNHFAQTGKIMTKVDFPYNNLNINEIFSPLNECKDKYSLYGVICHYGFSLHGGHYVNYCKNSLNNKWYNYNDESVMHIPFDKIKDTINQQSAYILFYKKNNHKISSELDEDKFGRKTEPIICGGGGSSSNSDNESKNYDNLGGTYPPRKVTINIPQTEDTNEGTLSPTFINDFYSDGTDDKLSLVLTMDSSSSESDKQIEEEKEEEKKEEGEEEHEYDSKEYYETMEEDFTSLLV